MKKTLIYILLLILYSCNKKAYKKINSFQGLVIQDTLINNSKNLVFNVGDSVSDVYPNLLVKTNSNERYYLFDYDCELKNDSIILSYYPAFIIDEDGGFRKNGLWLYADFYKEGNFPFSSSGIKFNVDSIPPNWNKPVPRGEGIYFYEGSALKLLSSEQSEDKFKEEEKDGFYFIPNSGRLYDKININRLE